MMLAVRILAALAQLTWVGLIFAGYLTEPMTALFLGVASEMIYRVARSRDLEAQHHKIGYLSGIRDVAKAIRCSSERMAERAEHASQEWQRADLRLVSAAFEAVADAMQEDAK